MKDFQLSIAKCLLLLFILIVHPGWSNNNQQQFINDSIINKLESRAIQKFRQQDSLLYYYDFLSKTYAKTKRDYSWKFKAVKAWRHMYLKQYDSAAHLVDYLFESFGKSNSQDERDRVYNTARLNLQLMRYTLAEKQYTQLYKLAEVSHDTVKYERALLGLVKIATRTHNERLEKEFLDKLLYFQRNTYSETKGYALQLYAELNIRNKAFESARKNLLNAKHIYSNLDDSIGYSATLNTLGFVLNELNNPDSALVYYQKSVEIARVYNQSNILADSYGNMGLILNRLKNYDLAKEYMDSALVFSKPMGNHKVTRFAYYHLAHIYEKKKDYNLALKYFREFYTLSDSLKNEKIQQVYAHERTRFNTEKKEQALEILSLKYEQNRLLLFFAIGFTVLLIMVFMLLYRQNKLKNKNKITSIEKQMAELKQLSLRQQMNPHFVFNTLNSIQYFMFQNDKMATNNYMTKFAMLIRKTLDNSQSNTVPLKHELEALELYIQLEQLRFKDSFTYKIEVDEEIDQLQYKIPGMLMQPFVENAINHGLQSKSYNGKLEIALRLIENNIIECQIKDNGIGRKKAEQIRKAKQSHNSLGTSITENRLEMIRDVTGSKLKIEYVDLYDNDNATGTMVIVQIPISS
jgi:two-component system LytT family sensor kinase